LGQRRLERRERERKREIALLGTISITGWSRARRTVTVRQMLGRAARRLQDLMPRPLLSGAKNSARECAAWLQGMVYGRPNSVWPRLIPLLLIAAVEETTTIVERG